MAPVKAEKGTTAQVSARVPKEVADYLQAIADRDERSLSWVVAYVLKEWHAQKVKALIQRP
jgi:predicted transcriptional regulator